jgi:signal transduction histidine kinase
LLHAGVLALTLTVFAVLSYQILSQALYRHHDDELAQQANDMVAALEGGPLTEASIQAAFSRSSGGSRLVMVRDNHGALLYRNPILQATEPALGQHAALVHAATGGARTPEFFTVTLEQSGDVRFVCAPVSQGAAYVQIGDPLGDVRAMLHTIALACLPLIPIVLLLSGYGGWMIADRALAPMRSVTATLEEIRATDLSRRVDVQVQDEDVGGLIVTLNHLLDRLERSFHGLREFAGDVSHELQTPLTVMKGTIDARIRRPEHPGDDRALLGSLAEEIDDMSAIVSGLRTFALADAPMQGATALDFSALVLEAADIIAALGELRSVTVESDVQSQVTVRGDSLRLKRVILNLGDNAVKYTPEGGHVTIRLRDTLKEAVLEIKDSGIGIPNKDLPRIFDRFFRAGTGDHVTAGTGLGLAIARRIVEVHRGVIEVQSRPGEGSTFTVRLPEVFERLRG